MNPIKIFELKEKDLMQGLSIQSGLALGGLFQNATNFDPFETMGYLQPTLAPAVLDESTITTKTNYFCTTPDGYVYALGHRAGTGGKCLYRINVSDLTVTDYSDQIDQNAATGALPHNGIAYYGGRIIYEQNNSIRSNSNPPTTGNDVNILTTDLVGSTSTSPVPTAFCVGPDGYLYYTAVGGYGIGKIVTINGTTSNINNAFTFTDHNLTPKDITSDGNYLIIIADDNANKVSTTNTTCKVFFWDTIKTKADYIFDIPDSYLISCRYVNNRVEIIGKSGIWICNSVTSPKLIFPLTSTRLPSGSNQVTVKENTMYWASASTHADIYAYGSKIGDSKLYSPFQTTDID